MKNTFTYFILLFLGFNNLFGQLVPYEEPLLIQDSFIQNNIHTYSISEDDINQILNLNIIELGSSRIIDNKLHIFLGVDLFEDNIYEISFNYKNLPFNTKLFIIDNNKFMGPLLLDHISNFNQIVSGNKFILELVFPLNQNINEIEFYLSEIKFKKEQKIDARNNFIINKNNRDNPVILITGFWPPTNEMIRHFSQNIFLNSEWEGENWQGRGYDIVSYFPEFSNPNCNNCGQGYGDLEVDYQDTSSDFWDIVENHSPIAIITFSRGFIDYSWELEYNYFNRTNWYADYSTPTLPTPNPPDDSVESFYMRNSNLPMNDIVDAINQSNLGLDSYIDINGDPGRFVSEFMGYHGVWYHDINVESCYVAGHIHVGGLIDWDTAKEAAEISILKTIDYLDQFSYIPGDINSDDIINILDLVLVVNFILGVEEFSIVENYAADMNSDGTINIQDIILIINIILN
tara:strand:+ start:182 stop:1558 length:1377 start_codon:yes stop_codon:yes gene_type:complete